MKIHRSIKTLIRCTFLLLICGLTFSCNNNQSSTHQDSGKSLLNKSLTLSVEGDGYFVLSMENVGRSYYRRSVTLGIDNDNAITTLDGDRILGYKVDPLGNIIYVLDGFYIDDTSVDSGQLKLNESGRLYYEVRGVTVTVGQVVLARFEKKALLDELGPYGDEWLETFASGRPINAKPTQGGLGTINVISTSPSAIEGKQTPGELLLSGSLDLSIWGRGYFVVNRLGQQGLMRSAKFSVNSDGRLVTENGWVLQGRTATNGAINFTTVEDIVITGHGVDIATITISRFGGLLTAGEEGVALGQIMLAYYPAPLFLQEIEAGVWQKTAASGDTLISTFLTDPLGYLLFDHPASEIDSTLDLGIDGEGYFVWENDAAQKFYTRSSTITTNSDGLLVTGRDYLLKSIITVPYTSSRVTAHQNGRVSVITSNDPSYITNIGYFKLALFPNPAGLTMIENGVYIETEASGIPALALPGNEGVGTIIGDTMY